MSDNLLKYGEVHWSLPMLFQYEAVYAAMYRTIDEYGIRLPQAYLFGSPSCEWTGGRPPTVFNKFDRSTILKVLNYVYQQNAIPTFTFSCTNITKESLKDKYANFILDTALETKSRFIVYSDLLRDYIKSKDPNATVVASVIKPALWFQGPTKIEEPTVEAETAYYNKLLKEYDIVVVRPEYSKGPLVENPSLIDDLSRIEVLINQTCVNNCPKMPAHYKFLESMRNEPNQDPNNRFECVRANVPLPIAYQNYLGHSEDQVKTLVKAGVKHLKLQGRSDSFPMNIMMMLMASQMFNLTGQNYSIATSLAMGRLNQEINMFNAMVSGQPPQQMMQGEQKPQIMQMGQNQSLNQSQMMPMQNPNMVNMVQGQTIMPMNQNQPMVDLSNIEAQQPMMNNQMQNQMLANQQSMLQGPPPLNPDNNNMKQGQIVDIQPQMSCCSQDNSQGCCGSNEEQNQGCCSSNGVQNQGCCTESNFMCPFHASKNEKPKTEEEIKNIRYLMHLHEHQKQYHQKNEENTQV